MEGVRQLILIDSMIRTNLCNGEGGRNGNED